MNSESKYWNKEKKIKDDKWWDKSLNNTNAGD